MEKEKLVKAIELLLINNCILTKSGYPERDFNSLGIEKKYRVGKGEYEIILQISHIAGKKEKIIGSKIEENITENIEKASGIIANFILKNI